MEIVPGTALFCMLMVACDAIRKERVAAGNPVASPDIYPWIVYIETVYEYPTRRRKTRLTCPYSCTGSFIDIYGTVITAAHCVGGYIECTDRYNISTSCQLHQTTVTWGVISPFEETDNWEAVDNSRIIRFERSELINSTRIRVPVTDVALIYLSTFQRNPMTCRRGSESRPINIDPTPDSPDWSQVGTFAGFGVQPGGYIPETDRYCYIAANELSEIAVRYDAKFKKNTCCEQGYCYNAYAEIYEVPPDTHLRHPEVGGTCSGDSGGPYMVKEHGGAERMILRGTLVGSRHYGPKHRCSGFSNPIFFVKVSNSEVRNWLTELLERRYYKHGLDSSKVPAACEEL